MKRVLSIAIAAILFISCSEPTPIKVACVGDSITFGSKIINREENSYPTQLQRMLGGEYDVRNFGISGSTALTGSDRSYVGKTAFREMMDFAPDVLLLKLGTNDSNIALRDQVDRFEECYNAIIDSVYKISPKCRVVLLTPIKAHNPISQWGIDSTYIKESIVPRVQQIAYDRSLELIDLHPMFDKYEEYLIPDRIHPSALGAAKITRRLYEFLSLPTVNYTFDKRLKEHRSFHGHKCYEFEYNGNLSRVVVPNTVAKGKPWVLRVGLWGESSLDETDVALLERGFHVLYTDLPESPEAVGLLSEFIDYAVGRGLSQKCVIEALGRGGLTAYNYAAQHPNRVAMVYAEEVDPSDENPLIEKIEAAGVIVKLRIKSGDEHHPNALDNPDLIVEQILISTDQFITPTTVPTQGAEYRQMADWVSISNEISDLTATNQYDILLLGNSITQGFGSNRKLVRFQPGYKHMNTTFPTHTWLSAGIAGDRTEHLLYRILNGGYERSNPKYVIITIGINNLFSGEDSAESTYKGIVACVEASERIMPDSKIILYGTLPAKNFIAESEYISRSLAAHAWGRNVIYVDPFTIFAPTRTSIIEELYNKDKLHLGAKGYLKWCENMKRVIDGLN